MSSSAIIRPTPLKRILNLTIALVFAWPLIASQEAFAGLTGLAFAAGAGTITTPTPTLTVITETTPNGVVNATKGFNTVAGETVQINQLTGANAMLLVQISGGLTTFAGTLNANGKVWLINPDGMLFTGATINVGSLLLSTAGISNATGDGFYTNTSGYYVFDKASSNKNAMITIDNTKLTANGDGTINSNGYGNNGDIIIMSAADSIQNKSYVRTGSGAVVLVGGETFTADFDGDGLINYQVIGAGTTTPVNTLPTGALANIYVGTGSTINTTPLKPACVAGTVGCPIANRVIFSANVSQDLVLDQAINVDGYSVVSGAPASVGGGSPEGVNLNNYVWCTPCNATAAPGTTPSTAVVPAIQQAQSVIIPPLTRPITSLGDETVNDTVVDPSVANVTYARPYLVGLSTSITEGKLTLLSATSTTGSPTNLGNLSPSAGGSDSVYGDDLGSLSPSAGGNPAYEDNLGNLSPSAGGSIAGGPSGASCANSYLDNAWLNDPKLRHCTENGQVASVPNQFAELSPAAGDPKKTPCVKTKKAIAKIHHRKHKNAGAVVVVHHKHHKKHGAPAALPDC